MSEPLPPPQPGPVDPSGAYLWNPATNDWVMNPAYGNAPLPPSEDKHNGRRALIIVGILVAVFCVAVALGSGSSSGGTPAAPAPTPTPTPSASPSPSADSPKVDPAVLQQYSDETDNIAATAQAISDAANAQDEDAVSEACDTLGQDAADGLALPDTNIPGLDKEWDAAMNDYADASLNCGVSDYDRAATSINKATAHITKATALVAGYQG